MPRRFATSRRHWRQTGSWHPVSVGLIKCCLWLPMCVFLGGSVGSASPECINLLQPVHLPVRAWLTLCCRCPSCSPVHRHARCWTAIGRSHERSEPGTDTNTCGHGLHRGPHLGLLHCRSGLHQGGGPLPGLLQPQRQLPLKAFQVMNLTAPSVVGVAAPKAELDNLQGKLVTLLGAMLLPGREQPAPDGTVGHTAGAVPDPGSLRAHFRTVQSAV